MSLLTIAFFGFLVALPLGVGFARYLRTFFGKWLWGHMIVNFIVSGPLIIAGFVLGYQTTTMSGRPHFNDPHQVSRDEPASQKFVLLTANLESRPCASDPLHRPTPPRRFHPLDQGPTSLH